MSDKKLNSCLIEGKRVLVTGGSGFIGRSVCRHLIESGANVVNYDLMPWTGRDKGPPTIIGDVETYKNVTSVLNSFEPMIVIHLAAFASVTSNKRNDFSSIWNGTRVLADCFSKIKCATRLVNISTQLVIGPGQQPDNLRSYAPYTPYGEAKAEAEIYLDSIGLPFEVVHIRPTNIWGPHHPSYANSIMRYLETGWYLHPTSKDPIFRTYGFVENCARQIISAAFSGELNRGSILYAGDETLDSADYLDAMSRQLRGSPVRRCPHQILSVAAGLGTFLQRMDVAFPFDRSRLMRMSTNYQVPLAPIHSIMMFPKITFEHELKQTVDWYTNGAKKNWIWIE